MTERIEFPMVLEAAKDNPQMGVLRAQRVLSGITRDATEADLRAAGYVLALEADTVSRAPAAGLALGLVAAQAKVLDLHQECGDHYCEFHSGKEEEFAHECQTCDSIDRLRAAKVELGELLLTLPREMRANLEADTVSRAEHEAVRDSYADALNAANRSVVDLQAQLTAQQTEHERELEAVRLELEEAKQEAMKWEALRDCDVPECMGKPERILCAKHAPSLHSDLVAGWKRKLTAERARAEEAERREKEAWEFSALRKAERDAANARAGRLEEALRTIVQQRHDWAQGLGDGSALGDVIDEAESALSTAPQASTEQASPSPAVGNPHSGSSFESAFTAEELAEIQPTQPASSPAVRRALDQFHASGEPFQPAPAPSPAVRELPLDCGATGWQKGCGECQRCTGLKAQPAPKDSSPSPASPAGPSSGLVPPTEGRTATGGGAGDQPAPGGTERCEHWGEMTIDRATGEETCSNCEGDQVAKGIKQLRLDASGHGSTEKMKTRKGGYPPSNRCADGKHPECGGSFCGCECHGAPRDPTPAEPGGTERVDEFGPDNLPYSFRALPDPTPAEPGGTERCWSCGKEHPAGYKRCGRCNETPEEPESPPPAEPQGRPETELRRLLTPVLADRLEGK